MSEINEESKNKTPAFRGPEKEYITGFLDDPEGTTVELSDIQEEIKEKTGETESEKAEDDFDYEFDEVSPGEETEEKVDYVSEDVATRLLEKEMNENRNKQGIIDLDNEDDGESGSDDEDKEEKPGFFTKIRADINPLLAYFGFFSGLIVFCEVILRFIISKKIQPGNLWFLLFVPAQAAVFTTLCGFAKKHKVINKIVFSLLTLVLCIYYIAQLIYFKNFGSLLSVNLMGMGTDAAGNFGWAVVDTVKGAVGYMLIIAVPIIAFIIYFWINKKMGKGYYLPLHGFSLIAVVLFWFMAVGLIRLGGTDRVSAYYALNNSMADTDTTSARIGAMTTTVVESASYFLGIRSGEEINTMTTVDNSALSLVSASVNAVSQNTVSENEVPEEEPFVPEPHINENIDFAALEELATDNDTKSLCQYFGSKTPTNTNIYTGMFEDYSLIYICAESYSNLVIDPDVTPTLYKMANGGIVLNNFYNSFLNTTCNGEYAFQTSQWPDVSRYAACGTAVGSLAQSCEKFMPYGLGDLFATEGIPSYAYHNYLSHYYRRGYAWPNFGYENMKFMGEGMSFTYTWPASDLEMMEQSIDDYIEEDQFVAYYMTFSGHGPYSSANCMYNKNVATVKELLGDRANDLTYDAIGYLACNYELELAMEYLLERLDEAGKLETTLIVMTGDHTPYYLSDTGKQTLADYEIDQAFELYRSSCIMYTEGLEEPIISDTYCCNVDILPTVLNLFGIDYDSRLLMGNDIFSDGIHRARIYNGSFLTDVVNYNANTGETTWKDTEHLYTQEQLDNYLDAMIQYVDSEYSASNKMLNSNFPLFVWKNSGLMTDEEYAVEVAREQEAETRAYNEAAEEAQAAAEAAALAAIGLNPDGTPIEGWVPPEPQPDGTTDTQTQAQPEAQPQPDAGAVTDP